MAASDHCFVEWKEEFVSKERGKRIVHYFLKGISGESILAVVGTERSLRHMFYVVSDDFLNVPGAESSVHAGFRWRSRREVVNWLTSMLSKQHGQGSCSESRKDDLMSGVGARQTYMRDYEGHLARNLKGHTSDIVWSGVAWSCGKQLKHYPSFCRNGITIVIQSFVFVMAERENRYLAYLEDMYEDRKGQKKVKVRWFHHNREVKGVVALRNPDPKEVFITPYTQVISAECVDGPAIVLTREHYEKCVAVFPHDLLTRLHFCYRQFKSNRVKPFKLSKLHGYLDQPIFSCFGPDFFEDEEYIPGDDVKLGAKRTRSCRANQMMMHEPSHQNLKYNLLSRRLISQKHIEHGSLNLNVNEKIELLCQDSGIRGCWFRCTVLEVSRRLIKVQYNDLKDEGGCGNLEEWIPAFRLAMPDKLRMRYLGRPTIRPALAPNGTNHAFEVGAPVDAWWSDGWWEGVVTAFVNSSNESCQVYIPSEDLFLNVDRKSLRISRDWVGSRWVDVEPNPDVLSAVSSHISPDAKLSVSLTTKEAAKSDGISMSCNGVLIDVKLDVEEDMVEVAGLASSDGLLTNMDSNEKQQLIKDGEKEDDINRVYNNNDKDNDNRHLVDNDIVDVSHNKEAEKDDDFHNKEANKDDEVDEDDNGVKVQELETVGQKCKAEPIEVGA